MICWSLSVPGLDETGPGTDRLQGIKDDSCLNFVTLN